MEVFGIIGMSLGSSALVFALNAMARVSKLEKHLKEIGTLSRDYESK